MSIVPLLVTSSAALIIGSLARGKWRCWSLLVASILAIYWLQPASPIRHLDFWLPTACIILAVLTWVFTRPAESQDNRPDVITGAILIGLILLVGITRYLGPACCLTSTRPPSIDQVVLVASIIALLSFLFTRYLKGRKAWLYAGMAVIIGLFIILKSEFLANFASQALRSLNSQPVELASAFDLHWLGFSYVAFRLIHTLLDRLNGRLPGLGLQEFIIYVIFFPAFTAGPIDRVQRFTQDLRQPFNLSLEAALGGGKRILIGIFSKFVLADGLALFALSTSNAGQVISTGWLWVLLYAFALRIYFDFSGYTDIAIGMGQLLGIRLPENFEKPYLKPNLTQFWNSWHMTLAQWFRAYFFNPVTRTLRSDARKVPIPLIILVGQLSTFMLIGLWLGISWNFAIWGAWHGLGLFIHNRWADWTRPKAGLFENRPGLLRLTSIGGTFLTFNFVSLGWVWFALATPAQSLNTFLKLFGLR